MSRKLNRLLARYARMNSATSFTAHSTSRAKLLFVAGFSLIAMAILPIANSDIWQAPRSVDAATAHYLPPQPNTLDSGAQLPLWLDNSAPDESPADRHLHRPRVGVGLKSNRPTEITSTHWTNLYPGLNAISVVSSTEAWAGGERGHLARFAGGTWTALDPLALRQGNIDDLNMLS